MSDVTLKRADILSMLEETKKEVLKDVSRRSVMGVFTDSLIGIVRCKLMMMEPVEQQRWVPVEGRLPKAFEVVLAWVERDMWGYGDTPTKTQGCAIGWQLDGSWQFDGYGSDGTRCIAWRPLPELYREGEES